MAASYFTGVADGKEAFSLLSPEGKEQLKEHKLIGIYLVYISGAMILLKLLWMAFSKVVARLFFIFMLIGLCFDINSGRRRWRISIQIWCK